MSSKPQLDHFINNRFLPPKSNEWIQTYNPYTAEVWGEIPRGKEADAKLAVDSAHNAFHNGPWRQMTASKRGVLLRRLGDLVARDAEKLASIEVLDNGKLFAEMRSQLEYIPQWFHYYAGLADKVEGAVIPTDKPDTFAYTVHEPLGVVVAITPWNSPLLITAWKLAPALAAGNTVIIKPSEYTTASSLEFAKLITEAGFPPGVVNIVSGYGHEIGDALVRDPRVAKVSFTGGEESGRKVYSAAADGIKRVTLELGGKSPNLVFEDAEIENAVKGVISGIFAASGQTCIAGSRLLVQSSIHDKFVEQLLALAKTAKMGDPMDSNTQVGPVATVPQYEKILSYIDIAKKEGAQCVLGGQKGQCGNGWFVEPTIFTGVNNKMRIAQEEVFGPVLSIIPFDTCDEAISIANDIPYGLAAGVWTTDMRKASRCTKELQAGTVWVNTYRAISYLSPFGGFKKSGFGRESGKEAIYDYLQTKSVMINHSTEAPNPFVMR